MKLLNSNHETESVGGSLYWNRGSGTCYNGRSNATTSCDFTTKGLTSEAKKLISEVVWYTGSNGTEASYNNILTSKFYELERSSNTGKICTSGIWCNDNVTRTTTWTGYIGLMSPSDYGYATSGGSTTKKEACLNTVLNDWDGSSVNDCKTNDWLYKSGTYQWTITPTASSSLALNVFYLGSPSLVYVYHTSDAFAIVPVLFLNSNVKITSGEGDINSPFILSLN